MNIVFFGNGDIGVPSLDKIHKSADINLLSVVTNPPKKAGRGLKIKTTPVHQFCTDCNIPHILNNDLSNARFIDSLKELKADLFIVISYKIMPEEIFNIPEHGSINLHPSLLPKYR